MALLSFVESAPRAYRLKVGNADLFRNSTEPGTSPAWKVQRVNPRLSHQRAQRVDPPLLHQKAQRVNWRIEYEFNKVFMKTSRKGSRL
jgi:hypothetical protein